MGNEKPSDEGDELDSRGLTEPYRSPGLYTVKRNEPDWKEPFSQGVQQKLGTGGVFRGEGKKRKKIHTVAQAGIRTRDLSQLGMNGPKRE